jgi:hypothetical protein
MLIYGVDDNTATRLNYPILLGEWGINDNQELMVHVRQSIGFISQYQLFYARPLSGLVNTTTNASGLYTKISHEKVYDCVVMHLQRVGQIELKFLKNIALTLHGNMKIKRLGKLYVPNGDKSNSSTIIFEDGEFTTDIDGSPYAAQAYERVIVELTER